MNQGRGSLLGRLLAVAVTIFVAATAVVWAVRLIVSVWVPLVVITGVVIGLAVAVRWFWSRTRTW